MNCDELTNQIDQALLTSSGFPPNSGAAEREASGLSITVVFTTIPATLMALQRGGELARQLDARIRVVVPHIVPYPLPIDRAPVDPEIKIRCFRAISVDAAIEIQIDLRLCRDAQGAIMQSLCPRSVVLIGGRKCWWPTREKHLAQVLRLAGHHVILVQQG